MKSYTLTFFVLYFQMFFCGKCGTEPISCCPEQTHRIKRDTQTKIEDLATALNVDDLNLPQPPSVLDNLIQNGLLPSQITQQLERILKNFTEIIRRANYTVEVQTEAVSNDSLEFNRIAETFKKQYPLDLWKKHGWFEDDYLRMINIHWLKFPPTPKAAHYALAFIYSTVALCGFFGNVLVIFMFFKCQSLRTPANILIVNLAFSDFLMVSEIPLFIYNSVYLGPALGQTACTIYGFIGGITGTVSIGTLTAIAFDRYSVVVYPLEPLRSITKLRAKLSVLAVWLYGGFFASIPALDIGLGRYVPEGLLTSCSFDYLSEEKNQRIFILIFFFAAWVLPLSIITFCYVNILRIVVQTRSMDKKAGSISSRHCKEQEKRKTELKLAGIVIAVISLFFAAWTPYAIVSLLGIMGRKDILDPLTSMLPAIFCKIASCVDPFVYIVTHPKFRQECQNLLISKKEQRRRSTMRLGYSTGRQPQQEITSEDGVEIVEMGKLPFVEEVKAKFQNLNENSSPKRGLGLATVTPVDGQITTLSLTMHNKSLPLNSLPKSIEENKQLQPPSWYVKPQFNQQRGNSLKKVVKTLQRVTSEASLPT